MMEETERKLLLTVDQFRELARPTSAHLDEGDVLSFVRECEDSFIIPAIGYQNLKAATGSDASVWGKSFDDTFKAQILCDGGEWTFTDERTKETDERYCPGIRKALAYFVYAKMLRADGTIIARAGSMRHRDDYSDHIDEPQLRQYNDVMGMAERYLSDCLSYASFHKLNNVSPVRATRARIKAIGD